MRDLTIHIAATDDGYVQAKAGLIRKRGELAAEVEALNRQLLQRTADMRAVEAALRVLEPYVDVEGLPVRQPLPAFQAFRGELARFLLSALRNDPNGPTTRDLTLGLMRDRQMDDGDPGAAKLMQRRVSHSLLKLRDKGMVRSEAADASGLLRWWLI